MPHTPPPAYTVDDPYEALLAQSSSSSAAPKRPRSVWWTYLAVLAAILVALPFLPGSWASWRPATCLPDACFCERPRDSLLRQPTNTWSNLAFVVAGALAAQQRRNAAGRVVAFADQTGAADGIDTFYVAFYIIAAMFIGTFSGWYHASLTFIGQWFDNEGMYLIIGWSVAYNAVRAGVVGRRGATLLYAAIAVSLGASAWFIPSTRRIIFGLLIGVFLVTELVVDRLKRPVMSFTFLWRAAGLLGVAFALWNLDLNHIVCWPSSLFQLHGVWHCMTAAASHQIFMFMASYRAPRTPMAAAELF